MCVHMYVGSSDAMDWNDLYDVTLAAAASSAFCGLLRVGEYAADRPSVFDSKRLPVLADCRFGGLLMRCGGDPPSHLQARVFAGCPC